MSTFCQKSIQQSMITGQILLFPEIDSTNEYLLKHADSLEQGSVCIAETQTAGKARRGKQWYSPNKQNLYLSILWRYSIQEVANLSPLSLVVGCVVATTLQQFHVKNIQLKWPNDIYYHHKKLGGILIETKITPSQIVLVIGIGLNFGMNDVDHQIVTQPWANLSEDEVDRHLFAQHLIKSLQQTLINYPQSGLIPHMQTWHSLDLFYQQPVKLLTDKEVITGTALGITPMGELILQQGSQKRYFSIGEISLRKREE